MGKLNIAHHKSYHPYRRDNIERVRRDEEEAAQKEAEAEGRVVLADAEARLDLLRERAGLGKGKGKKKEDDMKAIDDAKASTVAKDSKQGHINLFEDLEQQETITAIRATKKTAQLETEKGVPLAPSAKDLKPWYSERDKGKEYQEDEKGKRLRYARLRDLASKTMNDPLTAITHQLASSSSSNNPSAVPQPSWRHSKHRTLPDSNNKMKPPPPPSDATTMRLTRESSERERALALIRRKQREMRGSETPSTVHGGLDEGYGDVFNRREVEEAHSYRRRRW
ncbi:uncharacterized protein BJ212DRAFT_1377541 [Suillus subaureus]|uniref:CBF1-interacting co-repressor CIR N-terminal domain-containing protein n=1 Tax=Suillus subaureus TaxID=48587 RepID=A0A9P7E3Z7_9AGAM|nr:uncharacterized protein BJ212DRAFT_1377541 [Suillus subaureus]KAG1810569.1 hypothetical protein BJ212DRAFT_1377541 [Suillus subaureus]